MRRQREEQLDRVFGALSDRTRRALLEQLREAPRTVTQLAKPFDVSLPAISRHLKVLERAGLVRRSIDGRVHHCALSAAPLSTADAWLERYRAFWTQTLNAFADFVEGHDP